MTDGMLSAHEFGVEAPPDKKTAWEDKVHTAGILHGIREREGVEAYRAAVHEGNKVRIQRNMNAGINKESHEIATEMLPKGSDLTDWEGVSRESEGDPDLLNALGNRAILTPQHAGALPMPREPRER